jgi:excinuclease ABC subunit C
MATKSYTPGVDVKKLPHRPGVYFFKDKSKKVIYVGKALDLKKRVASYFYPSVKNQKTKKLVSQINQVDFLTASSEFEALLLEAKLIKEYLPKFNVSLKDNKRYLYIAISKEKYPAVFLTRRPEMEEKLLDWFGPFPSAYAARQVLKTVRKIFPFRSPCKMPPRGCLYLHINLCPAMCQVPTANYKKTISRIRNLLNGQTKLLLKQMEKTMSVKARQQQYEEALYLKQEILALKHVTFRQAQGFTHQQERVKGLFMLRKLLVKYQGFDPIVLNKIEGFDISNLGKNLIVGSMVAFVNGSKENGLYRRFKINFIDRKSLIDQNDTESIRQVICRRLNHPEWLYPQLIVVDGGRGQVSAAFSALKEKDLTGQINLIGIAKEEEKLVIPQINQGKIDGFKTLKLAANSPALKLIQQIRDESHRFAQNYYKLLHRKISLNLGS